jgi:dihydrofolate reductase
MKMGRIVVTEYMSVDGVVEAPSGTEDFERVGWTDAFSRGPEGDKFKWDETMASDALLLGRGTYDGFAPVWPHIQGEFADKFNAMPKYAVSTTLERADWNNTTVVADDVLDRIRALRDRENVLVWGSPTLVKTLMEEHLVDEYVLLVSPIVLGHGKKLLPEDGTQHVLRVVESRLLEGGMVALRMTPAT